MSFFSKLFGNQQPMDWKAFATYYADYASQQLGQPVEIEWGNDMEQTTIRLPNGQGGTVAGYLGNFYAIYRQNPEDFNVFRLPKPSHQKAALPFCPNL